MGYEGTRADGPAAVALVRSRRRGRLAPSAAPAGKEEIVEAVQAELDTSRSDAVLIVDGVARVIARLAARHQLVRVPHLGNFRVLTTGPREGRNPRTGESVPIGPGRRVTFRAARALKDSLNRPQRRRAP